MISLAAVGSTIANNRAVQWAIGVGILVLSFLFWLAQHDRRLLQNERLRAERKARKTQESIRKTNDEKSAQMVDARAAAPSGLNAVDELPDSIRSALIRD
jgi:hypothetical protein